MAFIHKAKRGKSFSGALKVDMAKAYDRLDCVLLEAVLKHMNFPERLIGCILSCVSSASYYSMLNGQISFAVQVNRGLKQGDYHTYSFCV